MGGDEEKYLGGDEEKYYEIFQRWKIDHEKKYLEQFPHLSRAPIRHKKVLSKSSRASLFIFNEPLWILLIFKKKNLIFFDEVF